MKLLLYSWNANNEQILADNLIEMGFEVIWFRKECRHYTRDMELAMEMIPFIHAQKIEAVVSFNYFPIVSMICNTCQTPYYAWVYDCPHFTLYAKQVTLPCNHIGIFDRQMVRQLDNYGINTVYHVPLSVDTAYFGRRIARASQQEKVKYQSDISFVGSLYTDEHNYYDTLFCGSCEREAADAAGLIHNIIEKQCFSYHKDYLQQAVTDGRIGLRTIQMQMEKHGLMLGEDYFARPEEILMAAVLEKKVTVEERRNLLMKIIKRFAYKSHDRKDVYDCTDKKYDFRLYTNSDTSHLTELDAYNYGTVDYQTGMPFVFAGSKINLNISLRSIHSGIPLRVLDIMACGGFVLSNWQPEIAESFKEGVEVVTFDSAEDCLDKIEYYLIHEEERRRIIRNGQRKVEEKFSYKNGINTLLGL